MAVQLIQYSFATLIGTAVLCALGLVYGALSDRPIIANWRRKRKRRRRHEYWERAMLDLREASMGPTGARKGPIEPPRGYPYVAYFAGDGWYHFAYKDHQPTEDEMRAQWEEHNRTYNPKKLYPGVVHDAGCPEDGSCNCWGSCGEVRKGHSAGVDIVWGNKYETVTMPNGESFQVRIW